MLTSFELVIVKSTILKVILPKIKSIKKILAVLPKVNGHANILKAHAEIDKTIEEIQYWMVILKSLEQSLVGQGDSHDLVQAVIDDWTAIIAATVTYDYLEKNMEAQLNHQYGSLNRLCGYLRKELMNLTSEYSKFTD